MNIRPNSLLVIPRWVNTIAELRDGICATQLPADASTWGTEGFVVARITGGYDDRDLPVGRPVVELASYAVKPDTGRPLWGVANNVLSAIVAATRDEDTLRRTLTITANSVAYGTARVLEGYPLDEARKIYGDHGQYAKMSQHFAFHWVAA